MVNGFQDLIGIVFALALSGSHLMAPDSAYAQDARYYTGKTIRLIVGYSAGSVYDQYARLLAQYMPRHIPGSPEMIVQNMPGGGSLIAANYVYNVAKPDGLSVGMAGDGIYLDQLLGNKEVRYDVRRYAWIGSVDRRDSVLYMRADVQWKTVEDLLGGGEAPRCGATGSADQTTIVTHAMAEALGTKTNIVRGYPGGPEIDLAIERGEIHCRGTGITGHFAREPALTWHKNGYDRHILQTGAKRDPRMADTPTLGELMDKRNTPPLSRRVTQVLLGSENIGRPMMAPPGLAADRLNILRQAYAKALAEPEMIAELKKKRMSLDIVSGADRQRDAGDQQPAGRCRGAGKETDRVGLARIAREVRYENGPGGCSTMKPLSLWFTCFLLALFAPAGSIANSAEAIRIRIGYPSPSASFSALFAAQEGKLFEKHGLASELLYLQGVQITQVHVSGHVDFTVTGAPLPMRAAVEGADLALAASSIYKFIYKLIVDPGIAKPADLRGKLIAITTFGSLPDVAIRLVLGQWGMNADRDVKLVQVGRMSDMVVALSSKKIDAGVISDPTSFQAEKLGMKRLLDMADVDVEFANVAVAISRAYVKSHRDTALRFLKAYVEGTRRFVADKDFAVKTLAKYTGSRDQDILGMTYELFARKYLKKNPTLSLRGVEATLAMIADRNPKTKSRRAEEFVDTSLIAELEKSGFIESVWK